LLIDVSPGDGFQRRLRDGLQRLMHDRVLRAELVKCGEDRTSAFNWSDTADRAWRAMSIRAASCAQ
jgi:hypothetical protein